MAQNPLIKRYLDAGMAFTQMTQAKAEAIVRDLVKTGEVQANRTEELVNELLDRSRRNTEALLELVRAEVRSQLVSMGLLTDDGSAPGSAGAEAQVRQHREPQAPPAPAAEQATEAMAAAAAAGASPASAVAPAKAVPAKKAGTKKAAGKATAKKAAAKKAGSSTKGAAKKAGSSAGKGAKKAAKASKRSGS